jgi:hypothetical protein
MIRLSLTLLIFSLCLSCGKKKETPVYKVKSQDFLSGLTLSPEGIKEVQKVFNIFSPNGKLNLTQIKNVARTSPELYEFLQQIQLEFLPDTTYSADDFFALLGESNRILKWARTFDLHTITGWQAALLSDFPEANPKLLEQNLKLIKEAVLPTLSEEQRKKFLGMALSVGATFNTVEAFQLPEGSQGLHFLTLSYLANNNAANESLNDNTVSLLKLQTLLQYALLNDSGASETRVLQVSDEHMQRFNTKDPVSLWFLQNLKETFSAYYPDVKFNLIDELYWVNKTKSTLRFSTGTTWGTEHRFAHAISYDYMEIDLIRADTSSDLTQWAALDMYELSLGMCPDFRPRAKLSEWMKYFQNKITDPTFKLNGPDYCSQLTDTYQRSL